MLSQTYNITKKQIFQIFASQTLGQRVKIPTLSPFENVMFNKIVSSPRGIASVGYSTLSNHFKPFDDVVLKQRWEGDLVA